MVAGLAAGMVGGVMAVEAMEARERRTRPRKRLGRFMVACGVGAGGWGVGGGLSVGVAVVVAARCGAEGAMRLMVAGGAGGWVGSVGGDRRPGSGRGPRRRRLRGRGGRVYRRDRPPGAVQAGVGGEPSTRNAGWTVKLRSRMWAVDEGPGAR